MRVFLDYKRKGMTLPEVLISVVIGTMLVGIVLSMWYFAYRSWTVERIKTRLRINLEIAMERIKKEARLSSITYMSFYPDGATEYEAISFPISSPDTNGLYALDADGNINWDRSIIYHVYDNPATGKTELRRTEFTDNTTVILDKTERDAQLAACVADGDGSNAINGGNSDTKVIFENLINLVINPKAEYFDGYSPAITRSDNIAFGSVRLEAGTHTFKFDMVGKNAASTGYGLGIDTISISPSGCRREGETCAVNSSSGGTVSTNYQAGWSGNNYLEFAGFVSGAYLILDLYYDLWRESNFENSIRDNTILTGTGVYVQLAEPIQTENIAWQATAQTGSSSYDYPHLGEGPLANVAIRNILKGAAGSDYIELDPNQKKVRVKFVAHSLNSFTIDGAWIAERSQTSPEDATGTPAQLLFSGASSVTISAGQEAWSDWTTFAMEENKDYLVTFYTAAANVSYWIGAVGATNSYYATDPNNDGLSNAADAQAGDWINFTPSSNIYAVGQIINWGNVGTVTSDIYDTKIDSVTNPNYNKIVWNEYGPGGSTVSMEVRASDFSDMSGATSWSFVNNNASLPSALDGNRYVQFKATLSNGSPYTDFPWIDNVTIDWPGEAKMCDISGYFTKKPSYGIAKLTVDGQELSKGLDFDVTVYDYFQGETYEASLVSEIEPRNTGR